MAERSEEEIAASILHRIDRIQEMLDTERIKYEAMLSDALEIQAELLTKQIERHLEDNDA
jgi:hypothetical protein